jgi:hypothetical protein
VQAPADGTTAPFKITGYSRWQLGNLNVMVPSAFDKTISATGLGPMASANAMQRSSRYPGNSGRGGCTPKTDLIDPERRFTTSNDALQKGNSITAPAVASKDDVWGEPGRRRICRFGHFSHTPARRNPRGYHNRNLQGSGKTKNYSPRIYGCADSSLTYISARKILIASYGPVRAP